MRYLENVLGGLAESGDLFAKIDPVSFSNDPVSKTYSGCPKK